MTTNGFDPVSGNYYLYEPPAGQNTSELLVRVKKLNNHSLESYDRKMSDIFSVSDIAERDGHGAFGRTCGGPIGTFIMYYLEKNGKATSFEIRDDLDIQNAPLDYLQEVETIEYLKNLKNFME